MTEDFLLNIVLVHPEIPNNTGNIGRTCVGHKARLHLIEPLGFEISDKHLKRAGLDYWPHLDWRIHSSWEKFLETCSPKRMFFFTTKTARPLYEVQYEKNDYLVFGRETKGLGPEFLEKYKEDLVTLPMFGPIRSYNLANAVSVAAYEAAKQITLNSNK